MSTEAPRFYVHGAGRAGRVAWPQQAGDDAVFADHAASASMADKAFALSAQAPHEAAVVVAHSTGAVAAALAWSTGGLAVSHVIVLEPALYDVARGEVAIERRIRLMTQARDRAASGDLFGYWEIVAPLMFGRPATRDEWDADLPLAQRFADLEPPWGHGIEASWLADVRTLVLTGNWNQEYEAIASRLVDVGAQHQQLEGTRHRPQDHRDFDRVVSTFLSVPE